MDADMVHPTHSTELFPYGEDIYTITSARQAVTEARKLFHEIQKRLIDVSSNIPAHNQVQAWGSAPRDARLTKHASNKSEVVEYLAPKASVSPHTVSERRLSAESLVASTTSIERLALDEAEAMRSMESIPFLPLDSNLSLPDAKVTKKQNKVSSM